MKMTYAIALAGMLLVGAGCAGTPLRVDGGPIRADEKALGDVEGRSTGIMLFNFIPIGQNDRFVNAYDQALSRQPGATRIADVTIAENWFWAWVLNGYKTRVSGIAVGPK